MWNLAEAAIRKGPGGVPMDKYRALRNVPPAGMTVAMAWGLVILAVVVGVTAAALVYWMRRARGTREATQRFHDLAEGAHLGTQERGLLRRLARLAGLGRRPEKIFTDADSFENGCRRMTAGAGMCGGCGYLVALREKLGFETAGLTGRAEDVMLGHIADGTELTVFRQSSPENVKVYVTDTRDEQRELVVLPEIPFEARAGEAWVVRYPRAGMVWEFDAWAVSNMAGEIVIRPRGRARHINRRRYVRVPVRRPAQVAAFPFRKPHQRLAPPQFVPARVTEIGGPGLRVESPADLDTRRGQRMLVVTQLPARVLETVGIVRHVGQVDRGKRAIALELIGLDTSEIADLMQITNDLVPRSTDEDESYAAEPAAAGREN